MFFMCIVFIVHCSNCLLLPCIELDTANSLRTFYWNGKMSDPGHSIGSGRLPGSLRDFIALEKCRTQGISGSVAMCRHRKMSDPGHSIGSGQLPGSLRTVLEWKNVGPRGIESEAAESQLLWCLYFPASLGRFQMTHSFSFQLRLLRSQKMD